MTEAEAEARMTDGLVTVPVLVGRPCALPLRPYLMPSLHLLLLLLQVVLEVVARRLPSHSSHLSHPHRPRPA